MKKLSLISIVALSACSIFGPSYSGETTASPFIKVGHRKKYKSVFSSNT
ncbi:hypothetical protein EINOMIAG_01556 [Mannheimia haemolytica]